MSLVFGVLLMAYIFLPLMNQIERYFYGLMRKRNTIWSLIKVTNQSVTFVKQLWDWIYSGIPAKQTEKRESCIFLFLHTAIFLRAFRLFASEMMIKTTKVGLALWVLCMQGWLPSLVASCPQALRLTRAEDIFVLQRCIFTVFVFVLFHCICVCICICIWRL